MEEEELESLWKGVEAEDEMQIIEVPPDADVVEFIRNSKPLQGDADV
jgi:hypothetical protein